MSDETPGGGGKLRRVGRSVLWAPRRFFDPRFQGLAEHLSSTHRDLITELHEVTAHVDVGRDEATATREALELRIAQLQALVEAQTRASSAATTIIGRSVAEQRAALESIVGRIEPAPGSDLDAQAAPTVADLDAATAELLGYAGSHRGFAAQRGLWFNPPTVVAYTAQDVFLSHVNERIAEPAYVFRALAGVPPGSRVLDVGATESTLSLSLASLGYQVTAIDPRPYPVQHPNLRSVVGEVESLDEAPFDAVVCLSTIEHVGIGAYGVAAGEDADVRAMQRIRDLMVPGGLLALTTPYGTAELQESQRVYDREGLDRLLAGFDVEDVTILRHVEPSVWTVDGGAPASESVALVTARRPA